MKQRVRRIAAALLAAGALAGAVATTSSTTSSAQACDVTWACSAVVGGETTK